MATSVMRPFLPSLPRAEKIQFPQVQGLQSHGKMAGIHGQALPTFSGNPGWFRIPLRLLPHGKIYGPCMLKPGRHSTLSGRQKDFRVKSWHTCPIFTVKGHASISLS